MNDPISAEALARAWIERWNDGDPDSIPPSEDFTHTSPFGRVAIAAKAEGFMTAFPDMVVTMDSVSQENGHATFHWTWTGTNTGPGGTGKSVRISGYEQWTFSGDGLILESQGHYDEAEYQRQVRAEGAES